MSVNNDDLVAENSVTEKTAPHGITWSVASGCSSTLIDSLNRNTQLSAAHSVTTKRTRNVQAPSLNNVVKTVSIGGASPEIQSVTVESTDGLIFGGFTLDFNSTGHPVYMRSDESADDFEYKFSSLSTVGNITVDRSEVKNGTLLVGYSWSITFHSNEGDLPMIVADSQPTGANLVGYNGVPLEVKVVEVAKGTSIPLRQYLELQTSNEYTVQINAINSEGDGASSITMQNEGRGVLQLSFNFT